MKAKNEAQLITSLIIDDITNRMLVLGLQRMGFDSGRYFINASDSIFKLMGYDERNAGQVYDSYIARTHKIAQRYITPDRGKLKRHAIDIYEILCESRPQRRKANSNSKKMK